MLKKLMVGAVAGLLLVGVSGAMARVVDIWVVVGVDSASGTVQVEQDLCMKAAQELQGLGFQFTSISHPEPRLAALVFTKADDIATLFCLYNIVEEQFDLFE